jgi:uncharacterized membrane protein YuzA (DUF378 family)
MKCLNFLALLLIIVGALNWGLWGFFQFDLVAWIAKGNTTWLARFIYAVVGLAGVWGLGFLGKCKCLCGSCSCCNKGSGGGSGCKM